MSNWTEDANGVERFTGVDDSVDELEGDGNSYAQQVKTGQAKFFNPWGVTRTPKETPADDGEGGLPPGVADRPPNMDSEQAEDLYKAAEEAAMEVYTNPANTQMVRARAEREYLRILELHYGVAKQVSGSKDMNLPFGQVRNFDQGYGSSGEKLESHKGKIYRRDDPHYSGSGSIGGGNRK